MPDTGLGFVVIGTPASDATIVQLGRLRMVDLRMLRAEGERAAGCPSRPGRPSRRMSRSAWPSSSCSNR
jgi:hypothetical protein